MSNPESHTLNPIDAPERQDFLAGLPALARVQVTRVFLQAVIPGISTPEDVCAAVRHLAMGRGFIEDHPFLSQWLVHRIDAGGAALGFAGWCHGWLLLPRSVQARWLADVADRRGALA
jgi:hypothetical protein